MDPTPSTSASPAPYHYRLRSAAQHADGPSPSKRRKLTKPASVSSSSSSFGHRNHSPDPQLDTDRRASSSRVLNVWSALADKYACRLDEDDIVDLRSGGLVRDRGVLSSKAGAWDIGCFADPEEMRSQETTGQDDDEEEDELGVWGSDAELDHRFNPVHVPPVRELDPEDAEDLRAFLAAEEARKTLHGADDDVSEDEAELVYKGGDDLDDVVDTNADSEESILEVEAGSALALSPTESDDELAGYDETVGEGALLWEVSTELSNCSEPLGGDSATSPGHHTPRCTSSSNPSLVHNTLQNSSSAASPPQCHAQQHPALPRPSPVPTIPSHDLWPPHPRPTHSPASAFQMSYSPPPDHARESSVTSHPEAQMYIAQALHNLSYFAFGAPPPPSSSMSHLSHHPHPRHTPSSSLSPPSWSYPPPHYPHHSHPYTSSSSSWPYPPYPYHYPPTPHAHPAALLFSPITSLMTPGSRGEPPSSSPESSSPLSGKGKGKRVSFPQEVVQSKPESDSDSDSNGGGKLRASTKEWSGKREASGAIPRGRLRRDTLESPSNGTRGKDRGKDRFNKTTTRTRGKR